MLARLVLALALVLTFSPARADTSPRQINMDDLPSRDLARDLVRVTEFTAPCDGALKFGRRGETLILDCAGALPLGREFHDLSNLNTLGEDHSAGHARTAYVFDATNGALLRSIAYANPLDLAPLAELVADGPWLAGTERSAAGPQIFIAAGNPASRLPFRHVRSQFIAAQRLDARRVAIVYEAWADPTHNNRFPEPFVAVVDTERGAILSDARLDWANGNQSHVIATAIDANGLVLFYRRFDGPPQQSDWYVGGQSGREVMAQRFTFDGQSQSAPTGFGFDAGTVSIAGDRMLVTGSPIGCRNVIAVLRVGGEVRQCYQRSQSAAGITDRLRRQRPTEAEQYSYDAQFMGQGELVVVVGQPGVDERARNAAAPNATYVFQADGGRYLGTSTAIAAVAADAPLLATRENGLVTIWRLNP